MEILIIDDEPLVAKILGRLLRPHSVQIISSPLDALEAATAQEFDLIFCDLMMPELSGNDLYARASEKKPGLADRFVFITGGAPDKQMEEFLSQESVRVIYKPFNREELRNILEDARAANTST